MEIVERKARLSPLYMVCSKAVEGLGTLEFVSKELNHFGVIAAFFLDEAPGKLTGGTLRKVYVPPVSDLTPCFKCWNYG